MIVRFRFVFACLPYCLSVSCFILVVNIARLILLQSITLFSLRSIFFTLILLHCLFPSLHEVDPPLVMPLTYTRINSNFPSAHQANSHLSHRQLPPISCPTSPSTSRYDAFPTAMIHCLFPCPHEADWLLVVPSTSIYRTCLLSKLVLRRFNHIHIIGVLLPNLLR